MNFYEFLALMAIVPFSLPLISKLGCGRWFP